MNKTPMRLKTKRELTMPTLNPRINAGASLGDSLIDELSFMTGLMLSEAR